MSIRDYGTVAIRGLVFGAYGTTTPIELPIDGVLVVDLNIANSYTLKNGETLKGISFVQGSQEFLDYQLPDVNDDANATLEIMIVLRAEPGGCITIEHQSVGVDSDKQINTSTGASVITGENRIQTFFSLTVADGWRLEVPDWSVIPFTANDAHWVNPNPTNMQDMGARIAAKLFALDGAID